MIDEIVDHWSCDWCGAKEPHVREGIPAGALWKDVERGRYPTRLDSQWPPGWHGFSPGDMPWALLPERVRKTSVCAAMCRDCLALPLISFDHVIFFFVWDRGSGGYRPAWHPRELVLAGSDA